MHAFKVGINFFLLQLREGVKLGQLYYETQKMRYHLAASHKLLSLFHHLVASSPPARVTGGKDVEPSARRMTAGFPNAGQAAVRGPEHEPMADDDVRDALDTVLRGIGKVKREQTWETGSGPVSYTHLTLPTNREV